MPDGKIVPANASGEGGSAIRNARRNSKTSNSSSITSRVALSLRRQLWDSAMLLLVIYTIHSVMLHIAFISTASHVNEKNVTILNFAISDEEKRESNDTSATLAIVEITLTVVYAIDLLLRCRIFDMNSSANCLFLCDVLSSLPLWPIVILSGGAQDHPDLRYFEVLRLLRLLRLPTYLKGAGQLLRSLMPSDLAQLEHIGFLFFMMIFANSMIAGVYYMLGPSADKIGGWKYKDGLYYNSTKIDEDPLGGTLVRLMRAMYFSIQTLFTVGYGDNAPVAPDEMVYAIILTLLGVVILGLVIGNMTSLFVNLDSTSAAFKSDLDVMEHVMSISTIGSNKIDLPRDLRFRIRTYSEYLWMKQRGLLDVQIMEGLPQLIQDRIGDLESKRWSHFPLFRDLPDGMLRALLQACDRTVYARGETIIEENDDTEQLIFVTFGKPEVGIKVNKKDKTETSMIHVLRRNDFYGLATFYGKAKQPYAVSAQGSFCDILSLSRKSWRRVLEQFPADPSTNWIGCPEPGKGLDDPDGQDPRVIGALRVNNALMKQCKTLEKNLRGTVKRNSKLFSIGSGIDPNSAAKRWWQIHEHSKKRVTWDILVLLVALYFTTTIPLRVAFSTTKEVRSWSTIMVFADLFCDIIFCIDRLAMPKITVSPPEGSAINSGSMRNLAGPLRSTSFMQRRGSTGMADGNHGSPIETMEMRGSMGRRSSGAMMQMKSQLEAAARIARIKRIKHRAFLAFEAGTTILSVLAFISSPFFGEVILNHSGSIFGGENAYAWAILRLPFMLRSGTVYLAISVLQAHLEDIKGMVLSNNQLMASRLFLVMFVIMHWVACAATVLVDSPLALRCVVEANISDVSFDAIDANGNPVKCLDVEPHILNSYMQALYWTLTTMTTVGFGDIYPNNAAESCFTILVMVVGVTLFSSVISFVTILMHEVDISEHNPEHHRHVLQRYMLDREISSKLQERILEYLSYVQTHGRITEERVLGLKCGQRLTPKEFLPAWLRDDVVYEMTKAEIRRSKLFRNLPTPFLKAVSLYLRRELFCPADFVVRKGKLEEQMFFLKSGKADVLSEKGVKLFELKAGSSYGEQALFGHEKLTTQLRAVSFCSFWILERRFLSTLEEQFPEEMNEVIKRGESLLQSGDDAKMAKNLNNSKIAKMTQVTAGDDIIVKGRKVFPIESAMQRNFTVMLWLALAWSLFLLPYRAAFQADVPFQGIEILWFLPDYFFDGFFFVDIFMRMRYFAVMHGSRVVTKPSEIPKAYLRGWGVYDLLAALPFDILIMFVSLGASGGMPTVQVISVFRLNRVMRTGRLVTGDGASIGSNIKDATKRSFVQVCKLALILMVISHWAGCIFFMLASWNTTIDSWASKQQLFVEFGDFVNITTPSGNNASIPEDVDSELFGAGWFRTEGSEGYAGINSTHYVFSLYWAVSTVTAVGYGDVVPTTMTEYIFTILILFLGGMMYSIIIANLEEIVAQADSTSVLFQIKSDQLKAFMKWRGLPPSLRVRITEYMLDMWLHQRGVDEDTILGFLNPSLRAAVTMELCGDAFKKTPVFSSAGMIPQLADKLKAMTVPGGDSGVIYEVGELADSIFYITSGKVELVSEDWSIKYRTCEKGSSFGDEDFLGEDGVYGSSARATVRSNLFILTRQVVEEQLRRVPALKVMLDREMEERRRVGTRASVRDTQKNLMNRKVTKMMEMEIAEIKAKQTFVMLPSHGFRRVWNVLMMAALVYNIVSITLAIGFMQPPSLNPSAASCEEHCEESSVDILYSRLFALDIFFDTIMLADIVLQCRFFARVHNGVLLKQPRAILNAYAIPHCGKHLNDITIPPLLHDCFAFFPSGYIALAYLTCGCRFDSFVSAICRVPRLYNIRLLLFYFRSFYDALDERMIYIKGGYRHLGRLMMIILITCHVLACGRGLLIYLEDPDLHYEVSKNVSIADRYIESLYFTMYTVTTVGYGNTDVITNSQKIYAMLVMIIGAFACDAGITSTLCSVIDTEDTKDAKTRRQKDCVTTYTKTMRLPRDLVGGVFAFHDYQLHEQKHIDETAVIASIPKVFESEVLGIIALSGVQNMMSIPSLRNFNNGMLRSLCRNLRPRYFMPDEYILKMGNPMNKLVFIITGVVFEHEKIAPVVEDAPLSHLTEGLVAGSYNFGVKLRTSFRAVTIVEAYEASEDVYKDTLRAQPKIAGLYRDFRELMADPIAKKHFKAFVDAQHCGENVSFYEEVQNFKRLPDGSAALTKKANEIYMDFIDENAKNQINIDATTFAKIKGNYKKPSLDIFDGAQNVILTNMERDSLARFIVSSEFNEMAKVVVAKRRGGKDVVALRRDGLENVRTRRRSLGVMMNVVKGVVGFAAGTRTRTSSSDSTN